MKIAILGLGSSIKEFDPKEFELSIGVNDIWKYHKTDAVVCLNKPKEFTQDRLKIINESTPKVFYSQMVIWDVRPDFVKIDILPGYPDRICSLDGPGFNKSYCSPFIAVQIAFKYYFATEIHLFGVDLIDHPFLDRTLCGKIKIHFQNLKIALLAKNCELIINGEGILKDI
jgi:hypothetical protein